MDNTQPLYYSILFAKPCNARVAVTKYRNYEMLAPRAGKQKASGTMMFSLNFCGTSRPFGSTFSFKRKSDKHLQEKKSKVLTIVKHKTSHAIVQAAEASVWIGQSSINDCPCKQFIFEYQHLFIR